MKTGGKRKWRGLRLFEPHAPQASRAYGRGINCVLLYASIGWKMVVLGRRSKRVYENRGEEKMKGAKARQGNWEKQCEGRDSNPRTTFEQILSQPPLATWIPSQICVYLFAGMGYEGFCTPGLSPLWVFKRHTRHRWKNADRTNSALHNLHFSHLPSEEIRQVHLDLLFLSERG